MSTITKQDLQNLEQRIKEKIVEQGKELREDMEQQGVELRKGMKQQGVELRKDIRSATDEVLEVVAQLAEASHTQFSQMQVRTEKIEDELIEIRRQISILNSDIDRAFKHKSITEEETVALIAGQRRLESNLDLIAKTIGLTLPAS